jgi:hypothetical protein
MDPRTGLGRFREFRISNYQLMMELIDACTLLTIEEILELPDVKERVELYLEHESRAIEQIKRCSTVHDTLVVLDLRDEEVIHPTNRFMVYALYPETNLSIHVIWGLRQQNTVLATGKSIIDRSSSTDVGELMLEYGGGGHRGGRDVPDRQRTGRRGSGRGDRADSRRRGARRSGLTDAGTQPIQGDRGKRAQCAAGREVCECGPMATDCAKRNRLVHAALACSVGLCLAVAAGGEADAARKSAGSCQPDRSKTVVASRTARVYTKRGPKRDATENPSTVTSLCGRRAGGRPVRMAISAVFSAGTLSFSLEQLAGRFASVVTSSDDRGGFSQELEVYDLRRRRRASLISPEQGGRIRDVALRSSGNVAWIQTAPSGPVPPTRKRRSTASRSGRAREARRSCSTPAAKSGRGRSHPAAQPSTGRTGRTRARRGCGRGSRP